MNFSVIVIVCYEALVVKTMVLLLLYIYIRKKEKSYDIYIVAVSAAVVLAAIDVEVCSALLLQCVGSRLATHKSQTWPSCVRELLLGRPDSAIYMLRYAREGEALVKLLQNDEQRKALGIDDRLAIDATARARVGAFHLPRFVIAPTRTDDGTRDDEHSALLRLYYVRARALVTGSVDVASDAAWQALLDSCGNNALVDVDLRQCAARMTLLLALFYETWPDTTPGGAARRAAVGMALRDRGNKLLGASDDHRLAFEFVLRGPRPARADGGAMNAARFLFSAAVALNPSEYENEWRTASLLIVQLSTLVGAPPTALVYSRTPFHLGDHLITGRYPHCPGAVGLRRFVDCSFKVERLMMMLMML